jgi:hypothetical protein
MDHSSISQKFNIKNNLEISTAGPYSSHGEKPVKTCAGSYNRDQVPIIHCVRSLPASASALMLMKSSSSS